jgi:hypothetical protein
MEIKTREYINDKGEKVIETRYRGRAVYREGGRELAADELMTLDYGKQGVTRVYASDPNTTPESKKRRDQHIREIAGRVHLQTLKNNCVNERTVQA